MTKKRSILVVDDDRSFSNLINLVFGEEFEVLQASEGEKGLAVARGRIPDVILLDILMPKVSGLEMLRALQSEPEMRKIPVVLITASYFEPGTLDMLQREPNVRAVLEKPCSSEELRSELYKAMQPG